MKILIVSDTYYPHINGVYYFVQRLASALQNEGHQIAIVAPSQTTQHSENIIDGIKVYGIASFSILYYRSIRLPIPFLAERRLKNILNEFQPDIIHIQTHFSLNKAMVRVSKKLGYPVIGTNHFMTENLTSFTKSAKWKKWLEKWMWKDFAKVFNQTLVVTTPSEMAANLIRPKLKVEVIAISNGIDLKKFFPRKNDEAFIRKQYSIPDKPILLYVGRLDPEKKIDEVLQAIALRKKEDDFCFVAVGKGVKRLQLETLATELGTADKVIFTGFVPDEDLRILYQSSRCFITASIAELQSIATMEAMASGLPIIAANAGALSELVRDGENGFLFEPGDVNAIASHIHSLFTDDDLYWRMKQSGLQFIKQHDIAKTVEKYKEIYVTYGQAPVLQVRHQLQS